jgi:hypothetical protein
MAFPERRSAFAGIVKNSCEFLHMVFVYLWKYKIIIAFKI